MDTFLNRFLQLQTELKAPKGQVNKFGGYKYRSCEDILEAVKPLLGKYRMTLTIGDDLLNVGERYYICATATPEIVYVEVTPTPGVVIIPGGEFDGDLDNLWVAIPVEGMPDE